MRILFVTQQDPFYLPLFFQEFFYLQEDYSEGEIEVVGAVIQPSLGETSRLKLLHWIWELYEPINFFRQAKRYIKKKFSYILYRLNLQQKALVIPALMAEAGVKVLPYEDVNSPEFVTFVQQEDVDLIISVSATQIFNHQLLTAPNLECINIHSSPLPEYRGMMPNFWQMYYGEDYSVLTIHKMVEKLDKGTIIKQSRTKIKPKMALEELVCQVKVNAARTLWEVLDQYLAGEVEYSPLPAEEGSYFSFPTSKEVAEFKARGNKLL